MKGVEPIQTSWIPMSDGDEAILGSILRVTGDPPPPSVDVQSLQNFSQGLKIDDETEVNIVEGYIDHCFPSFFLDPELEEIAPGRC
jgi:hypothetical protein